MSRIAASLDDSPGVVRLVSIGVPDQVWYELELTLTDVERLRDNSLQVPLTGLLESRRRVAALLVEADVALEATEDLQVLIRRSTLDDSSYVRALKAFENPEPFSSDEALRDGPYSIVRELREFQIENLSQLYRMAHGANFSVPGAGKTTVAYALHALLVASGTVDKLLVVAPLSAYSAWEEDAGEVLSPPPRVARMTGQAVPSSDVVLINYQRLPQTLDSLSVWSMRNKVHLVVDEAHRSKRGVLGEWGKALAGLAPLAVRRDILTGTPAPNHPRDLVALFDFLWPNRRVSSRIPEGALKKEPSEASVRSISRAISPFFVRTDKVRLKLPAVEVREAPVKMGDLQADIYDALRARYAGMLNLNAADAALLANMGEVTMYLLQAASSPRLLRESGDPARAYRYPSLAIPPGSRLADMLETYADHEVPAKIAAACRLIEENARAGRKTLVWSNFPDNLLDLQQQLAGLQPAVIYGGVPSIDEELSLPGVVTRERELARFKEDSACMVLLANPAAMSEGVSLHHVCHEAVYVDRTFNAGQYLQSLDRIHRLGLDDNAVTRITLLTSMGTIDERVSSRVATKAQRLGDMLADANLTRLALPDEEDGPTFIDDTRDLQEVLDHLAGR